MISRPEDDEDPKAHVRTLTLHLEETAGGKGRGGEACQDAPAGVQPRADRGLDLSHSNGGITAIPDICKEAPQDLLMVQRQGIREGKKSTTVISCLA